MTLGHLFDTLFSLVRLKLLSSLVENSQNARPTDLSQGIWGWLSSWSFVVCKLQGEKILAFMRLYLSLDMPLRMPLIT